jgi:hypothetical protein
VTSAIRLPLLCAFAGGCLSNALLFGLWRVTERAGDSAVKQQHRSDDLVELVTAASAAPSVAQPSELVATTAADDGHDTATEAAESTPAASDLDRAGPTPAGSAVSDVLTRLEAAYRERIAARAPAQASSQERATAAAPTDSPVAATEAAPAVPTQPVAEVIPDIPAVSAAPLTEPRATAPAALAPAALAPPIAAVPAVAAQDVPPPPPPPSEVYYGDINQNTYITNVRQGDVYLIQMQQLAMLQYMQLFGMSSGLAAASLVSPSAHHAGGGGHQRGALSSGITNPDNPWGFHFAPPKLVR